MFIHPYVWTVTTKPQNIQTITSKSENRQRLDLCFTPLPETRPNTTHSLPSHCNGFFLCISRSRHDLNRDLASLAQPSLNHGGGEKNHLTLSERYLRFISITQWIITLHKCMQFLLFLGETQLSHDISVYFSVYWDQLVTGLLVAYGDNYEKKLIKKTSTFYDTMRERT